MAYTPFNSPVDFIHDLSKADSLQAVLDTIAYWISHVFDADRASITLQDTEESVSYTHLRAHETDS